MTGRKETSRPGTKDCMRPLPVIAFGRDENRSMRRRRSKQCNIDKVDMSASRSAEQNHIEFFAALN